MCAGLAIVRFPVPGLRWHRGLKARATMEAFFRHHIPAKRPTGGDGLFAALCGTLRDEFSELTDVIEHKSPVHRP